MRTLYLDCISGISGHMLLAALVDLGADIAYIKRELLKLPIDEFDMWVDTVDKLGITAKKLQICFAEAENDQDHDHLLAHDDQDELHHENKLMSAHAYSHQKVQSILEMIRVSALPERVKARSLAVFKAIAVAESKIHDIDPAEVLFHEVGTMDALLDTIGICLALEDLAIDQIFASPVPVGYGIVKVSRGHYPIPAPTTVELLKGIPLAPSHSQGELTTPMGAGILKALVVKFGPLESFIVERIGYGAGVKDFDVPNVVRALLGQAGTVNTASVDRETIHVLEAQLDDCTAEACGYVMERLFDAGALDVYFTAVHMKKNRPGTLLTVLCQPILSEKLEELMLAETTTFGVRRSVWTRRILQREFTTVDTPYGSVRIKVGRLGEKVLQETPEYEDVARLARQHQVPFIDLYRMAANGNKNRSSKN